MDAAGDAAAETAIGAALSTLDPSTRATMVVATAVSAGAPGGLKAAAAAAAARLGVSCVDVLLLQWDSPADDSLAAAWAEMGALQAAGTATLVGLRCEDVLTAKAAFEHGVCAFMLRVCYHMPSVSRRRRIQSLRRHETMSCFAVSDMRRSQDRSHSLLPRTTSHLHYY